jgi:acyl-CoA synthetase (AMP-forming)/AMP-acid ligase II
MGKRLIHNELEKQAYWRPRKTAFAFEGTEYTYTDFNVRVNRVANALSQAGVAPGDRILAHGFDHVDWHTLFYACSKTGATYCPVSKFQSLSNLAYITETLDPRLVFHTTDEDVLDRLPTILNSAPEATHVSLDPSDDLTLDEFIAGASTEPPADKDDRSPDTVHNVFWTSGTTGKPKAVTRDHRSSLHFSDNLTNDLPFRAWNRRVTTNSMMLIDAYFHYGIPTVMAGGTNVILREFSPAALYEAVREYDINSLHLGFTLARLVLDHMDDRDERLGLRYLSAVIPSANIAENLWPHTEELHHLYGSTEIGLPLVKQIEPPFHDRPSLGKPGIGAEIRVVPQGSDEVPHSPPDPGDVGELACRGETTMTRYLDDATHRERVVDGWIRPGDVVRVNENRDLVFLGRTDDRIRSGGVNVYPGDIESVLEDFSTVENAIVVGVEDDTWGQRVCALIITERSDNRDDLAAELDDHCRATERIADEMRPRDYAFVASNDAVPTGALGKPDRGEIATRFFESP